MNKIIGKEKPTLRQTLKVDSCFPAFCCIELVIVTNERPSNLSAEQFANSVRYRHEDLRRTRYAANDLTKWCVS